MPTPANQTAGNMRAPLFVLGLAVFIGLALRLLYIYEISDTPFFTGLVVDQAAYDNWAQRIAAGDWLGSKPFYQDPLYPYFLAAIYSVFGRSLPLVYVIQAVMSSFCCLLVYGIGRRAFNDRRVGVMAAFFWAGFKIDFFYSAQLLKTTPGLCLLILCLWLFYAARDSKKIWAYAGAGFTLGLLLLIRGNFFMVAPFMIGWLLYAVYKEERKVAITAAVAVIVSFLLVPALTMTRNIVVSGEAVITTAQGGPNFYMGNFRGNKWGAGIDPPFAKRLPGLEGKDFKREAERRTGRDMTPAEVDRFWYKEAFSEIASEPWLSLKREVRKALLVINRYEVSDNLNIDFFAEYYSTLLDLPLPGLWLAAPFGFAGLIVALWRRKGGLLTLFAVVYTGTLLVFYVLGRYRIPLAPALFILSSYWIVSTHDLFAKEGIKKTVPRLVLLFVLVALSWPRWKEPEYAESWVKVGNVHIREDRPAEAMQAYERAIKVDPGLAESWAGLGMALELRMKPEEALGAYGRAVTLDPDRAYLRLIYAGSLEKTGRPGRALEQYRAALDLDPEMDAAREAIKRLESDDE